MMRPALLKLVLFQIVWLASAIGAAQGWSWPGIVTAVALVGWHLATAPRWRLAAMTVLAAGILGLIAESLLVAAGLLRYSGTYPTASLAPAWIVALWLAFSTTLETTRRLLGSHPFAKSACLGSCLGPLSYLAGERLGALAVTQARWPSYLAVAIIWGIAYPALLALEGRLTEDHLGSHKFVSQDNAKFIELLRLREKRGSFAQVLRRPQCACIRQWNPIQRKCRSQNSCCALRD
jgi:uncharacterized protein DUF2878